MTPRFSEAVLRALAALDDADEARGCGAPESYGERSTDFLVAQARLLVALQEERARRVAVPALPDEGERDASPHRFAHPHGGPL